MRSEEDSNECSNSANASLYAELERSLALCKIAQIDLALQEATSLEQPHQSRGGTPRDAGSQRAELLGHETREVDRIDEASASSSKPAPSKPDPTDILEVENKLRRRIEKLSEKEKIEIYTDVYGRKPQNLAKMDERMAELEYELNQIPPDGKPALLKAQRAFPLLFCTAAHTGLFLQAANYDAKLAAERMIKYWEKRLKLFGNRAFSPESFNKPTSDDYLLMYKNSTRALLDPETDEVTKEIAKEWIDDWNKTKVSNLDNELRNVPPNEKEKLIEAQEKLPDLASSDDHKLLFLQRHDFQEGEAARQMLQYWRTAYDIFGSNAFNPITLGTLREHSSKISQGFIWLLPGTDAFGRKLVSFDLSRLPPEGESTEGYEMALWYVCHAALEEGAAQQNGCVFIGDHRNIKYNKGLVERLLALVLIVPIKIKAVHAMNPDLLDPCWFELLVLQQREHVEERRVVHTGSNEKILSELNDFGIAKDQLPVEMGGSVEAEYREEWLKERMDAGK